MNSDLPRVATTREDSGISLVVRRIFNPRMEDYPILIVGLHVGWICVMLLNINFVS